MKISIKDLHDFFKENPHAIGSVQVNTPDGFQKINGCEITSRQSEVRDLRVGDYDLKCSPNHKLLTPEGWVFSKNVKEGDLIDTVDGFRLVYSNVLLSERKDLYDIEVDHYNHRYFSNGIVSHNSSLFMESVNFALFGKPFRKVNINKVVNNTNKRECQVDLFFNKGDDEYVITRGIKPNFFKIFKNKELVDESNMKRDYQAFFEEHVLEFDQKIFNALTVKSLTKYNSFLALPKPQKRELINNIFDLGVFQTMLEQNRQDISTLKDEIHELDVDNTRITTTIRTTQGQLAILESELNDEVRNTEKEILELDQNTLLIDLEIQKLREGLTLKTKVNELLNEYSYDITSLKNVIINSDSDNKSLIRQKESILKSKNKFETVCGSCPKLDQLLNVNEISDIDKRIHINDKKILDAKASIDNLQIKYDEQKEKENLLIQLENIINTKERTKHTYEIQKSELVKQSSKKINRNLDPLKETIRSNTILKEENERKINTVSYEMKHLEYASTLLKTDEFKNHLILSYLPLINKLMNGYLHEFNFDLQLEFDPSFNVEIRTKFKEDFQYDSFSEGEKKKMNMSFAFALMDFFRMKKGKTINNILIFDEFSVGLDSNSEEVLYDILTKMSNEQDLCIYTMSHAKLSLNVETIEIDSENGFTIIR